MFEKLLEKMKQKGWEVEFNSHGEFYYSLLSHSSYGRYFVQGEGKTLFDCLKSACIKLPEALR